MSGFQRAINNAPALAVAGDFASANPRASMLAGEGALVTAAAGVLVGQFAWAKAGVAKNSFQAAPAQVGFVHREMQAQITTWLAQASMLVPGGLPITLMNEGDFWALFAAGAVENQKVFASYADGSVIAGTAGTPPSNTSASAGTVDTTPTLTITVAPTAPIVVGQPVSGTGIPAGTYISALGTGTGGVGTYTMSANATATASVTVTLQTAYETNFVVRSTAAAGELAKISTNGR